MPEFEAPLGFDVEMTAWAVPDPTWDLDDWLQHARDNLKLTVLKVDRETRSVLVGQSKTHYGISEQETTDEVIDLGCGCP